MSQNFPQSLLFLFAVLMATTSIAGKREEQTPLTKKDVIQLSAVGKLNTGKVYVRQQSDILRIEGTGVVVQTKEADYMVIQGSRHQFEKLRSMGISIGISSEADRKLRKFRTPIHDMDELLRLEAIVTDLWPLTRRNGDKEWPAIAIGRAFDSELNWAKAAGLNIERCPTDNCD